MKLSGSRLPVLISLVLLVQSCGAPQQVSKFVAPDAVVVLQPMKGKDTPKLNGFKPGSVSLFQAAGTGLFGIGIRDSASGGEVDLLGWRSSGQWQEPLSVESSNWRPVSVKVRGMWYGDLHRDRTPELVVRAVVQSKGVEKGQRKREFLLIAELTERVDFKLFLTLKLDGSWEGNCEAGTHQFVARLDWSPDSDKGLGTVTSEWELKDKVCPSACGKAGPCRTGSDQGQTVLVWNQNSGFFATSDGEQAAQVIPDVDLCPGFRRLPR